MKNLISYLVVILLCGCACQQTFAQDFPPSHIQKEQPPASLRQDYAQLIVYRPWRYVSLLARMRLRINGQARLLMPNNSLDTLWLKSGTYTFSRHWGDSWPETLELTGGQTYFAKIFPSLTGVRLEFPPFQLAMADLMAHEYPRGGILKNIKP